MFIAACDQKPKPRRGGIYVETDRLSLRLSGSITYNNQPLTEQWHYKYLLIRTYVIFLVTLTATCRWRGLKPRQREGCVSPEECNALLEISTPNGHLFYLNFF